MATKALVVLIIIAAAVLRLSGIPDFPNYICEHEANDIDILLAMESGDTTVMDIWSNVKDAYGPTTWLTYGVGLWTPNYFVAGRYVSAILAIVSLIGTALLAWRYGRWAAVYSTLFLAGSFWHLLAGHFNTLVMSPVALAPFVFLSRHNPVALAICMVLAARIYTPAKLLPVVVGVWWVWHSLVTKHFTVKQTVVILLTAALCYFPLRSVFEHWDDYADRSRNVTREVPPLTEQLPKLAAYATGGADIWVTTPVTHPLLNPLELLLIGAGFLLILPKIREESHSFLIFMVVGTAIAVSFTDKPFAAYRAIIALPFMAILAGIAASRIPKGVMVPVMALLAWYNVTTERQVVGEYRPREEFAVAREISKADRTSVYKVPFSEYTMQQRTFRALTHRHAVISELGETDAK